MFIKYEITTPKRIVAFVTQAIVQTDNITALTEYTTKPNSTYPWGWNPWCSKYDGGCKYIGRGILQIHGLSNYMAATRHIGMNFVEHPGLMATYPYSFDESGYFWHVNGMNKMAEDGDWDGLADLLTVGQPPNKASRLRGRDRVSACFRPLSAVSSRCGFNYTCQEGDTIETITTRYRLLTLEIFYFNPELPKKFHVCPAGMQLIVPHC